MRLQRRSSGEVIHFDPALELGAGGEARVLRVPRHDSLAAKVYRVPDKTRTKKLEIMVAAPPDDPMRSQHHDSIAWPIDVLVSTGPHRQVVGFLMPLVKRGFRPIIDFYNPKSRRQHCWSFHYGYLHHTAQNLAAAVHALHTRGYIIGDVNESNILVSDKTLLTLVDTDSFQVFDRVTGVAYPCPVGKPEYTAPELQGQRFEEMNRTLESDRFGLAVLIFQLLMEGTHPFGGIYQGVGDPPSLGKRIAAGDFPWGKRHVPFKPMKGAPPLEILDHTLRALFLRCFGDGHTDPSARPKAQTWLSALRKVEDGLIECHVNSRHRYGKHLKTCPWCDRSRQMGGRDPFSPWQPPEGTQTPLPGPPKTPTTLRTQYKGRGLHAPARRHNVWAWAALASAFASTMTTQDSLQFRLWTGLAAAGLGAIGWIRSRALGGRGRWPVCAAVLLGGGFALSTPQFGWLWPEQASRERRHPDANESSHVARKARAVESFESGRELRLAGRLEEAEARFSDARAILKRLDDTASLCIVVGEQGIVAGARGQLDEAMRLYKEQELLCRKVDNHNGLQAALGSQETILHRQGKLDEAMKLYKEQEGLCRKHNDSDGLSITLGNQALILKSRGQLDKAMELYQEQEGLCRELADNICLQTNLGIQGTILHGRGQLDEAMKLYKEQEGLCREHNDSDALCTTLGNQALILKSRGQLDKAMELYQEQEGLCRELADNNRLQANLGNQGIILANLGRLEEALDKYLEQERLLLELRDLKTLADCYHSLAYVHQKMKHPATVRLYAQKAVELRDQLDIPSDPALREAAGMQAALSGND